MVARVHGTSVSCRFACKSKGTVLKPVRGQRGEDGKMQGSMRWQQEAGQQSTEMKKLEIRRNEIELKKARLENSADEGPQGVKRC